MIQFEVRSSSRFLILIKGAIPTFFFRVRPRTPLTIPPIEKEAEKPKSQNNLNIGWYCIIHMILIPISIWYLSQHSQKHLNNTHHRY